MPGLEPDKDRVSETGLMPQLPANSTGGCLLADQPSYCTSPPIEVVVFGWGVTEDGQLGLDSIADVPRPSVVESLLGTSFSGFSFNRKPLVAGSRHTLAVTDEGRVLSWGWNDRGTLGLGHRHTTSKPAVIHALEHEHIVQVAAGGWHCLAVSKSGSIYAWGGNEYFQCGVDAGKRDLCIPKPTVPFLRAAMVSCGGMHSVALTDTGEVWQWGEPWGDFSIEVNRSPRKLVTRGIVSITSGAFHNLALNSCNQVLAWGTNDFGQLGTGDTTYATEPTLTVGLDDVSVADISAGGWHSLALSSDGKVYTWGRGEYGRLGLNDPKGVSRVRPSQVPGLKEHRVIQALCGGSHTIALTDQGHLFTWGRCTSGRQGFDAQATVELPHPINMPGGSERWHPICLAAGGRCSMCMVLPRQTVTDHDRRITAQSSNSSWQGSTVMSSRHNPSAPRPIGTQSLKRRASSQALVHNPHLSRSMGAIAVPQSLTASQLVSSHELTFTVPTDRRAFARESTTDLGPSGESSTGSRRVSTLDNAPGVLASAVSEVEQQQMEVSPAHRPAEGLRETMDSAADELALDFDLSIHSPAPSKPDQATPEDNSTPRLGESFLQPRGDEYSEGPDAVS